MLGLAKFDREVKFVSLILILSYFLSPILVKTFSPLLSGLPTQYAQLVSNSFTTWVPAIVAFALIFIDAGLEGLERIFQQLKPKLSHLLIYLLIPVSTMLILSFALLIYSTDIVAIWQYLSSNMAQLIVLMIMQVVFIALGEEIGWRGYLQSNLLRKCSRKKTALFVFVAWAIWHWPKYSMLSYEGAAALTLSLLSFSFLFVYARNWINPYLLIFAIAHGCFNATIYFFEPVLGDKIVSIWLVTAAFYALIALAVVFQDTINTNNKNSPGDSSPYGHY